MAMLQSRQFESKTLENTSHSHEQKIHLKDVFQKLDQEHASTEELRAFFKEFFLIKKDRLSVMLDAAGSAERLKLLQLLKRIQEKNIGSMLEVFQLLSLGAPQMLEHYLSLWQRPLSESSVCQAYARSLVGPARVAVSEDKIEERTILQLLFSEQATQEKHLTLYFRELKGCITRHALTPKDYFQALTGIKVEGQLPLHYLARVRPCFLTCYLEQLELCAALGAVSLHELLELFRPLALNCAGSIHRIEDLDFSDWRLHRSLSRIVGLGHRDPGLLVRTLPGFSDLKTSLQSPAPELWFSCNFGRPAEQKIPPQEGSAQAVCESKLVFKVL